tara:strand:- start:70 stop:495 length:426 start_codon:yes stop_codon:yes gene_type:complete
MFVEKNINLVISQTNYDRKTSIEKLTKWNGDYMSVIKEYLNPDFRKKKEKKKETKNQRVISSIRNFMNDVTMNYNKREKEKMELEFRKKIETESILKEEEIKNKIINDKKEKVDLKNKKKSSRKREEIIENKMDGMEIKEL